MRLGIASGFVLVSCVACVGDTSATGDGGADAGNDVDVQDSNAPETVTETTPPTPHQVGGTVHFLQGAGPLVLQVNGAGNLNVTQNGTFTFGTTLNQGKPFSVTVLTQPANQVCSARNGTGSGIVMTTDVTNVLIECTVATESNATTIGALQPATFSNDVAAKGLVIAMFPEVSYAQFGAYADATMTIAVDGATVATSVYGNQPSSKSTTETLYAVVDLPVGNHSVTATLPTGTEGATFPIRLDAIVLDSLSTYSQIASGTATTATANSTTLAALQADVTFSTTSTSPVLTLFEALGVRALGGTSPGPALPMVNFQLALDTNAVSTAHLANDDLDDTVMLAGIASAPSGAHALETAWADVSGTSTKPKIMTASRADAIVLSPSAHYGFSTLTADQSTSSASFVSIATLAPISLTAAVASQALVILQIDGAPNSGTDGNTGNSTAAGSGGQLAIAVDNTVVTGGVMTAEYKGATRAGTIIALVPLAAGAHTLQAEYKATLNDLHAGAGSSLTAILIE